MAPTDIKPIQHLLTENIMHYHCAICSIVFHSKKMFNCVIMVINFFLICTSSVIRQKPLPTIAAL
jgi:D-alanyl-lipoteichoic acid acyltransferase DltB (MBOAT superfamily)